MDMRETTTTAIASQIALRPPVIPSRNALIKIFLIIAQAAYDFNTFSVLSERLLLRNENYNKCWGDTQ